MLLRDADAGVGNVDLYIHFPAFHRHTDLSACRGVLHCVIQNVEQSFACPFSIVSRIQMLWTFHLYIYLFLFSIEQNPAQGCGKGIINRLLFLIQRNDSSFQAGSFNHGLHEKVQLIKLTSLGCQKFLLLLRRNLVFKQRVVDYLQVGNRGLDLMGNIRDQLLQVSSFLCDVVFIFLHDFVQPPQSVVDFIK